MSVDTESGRHGATELDTAAAANNPVLLGVPSFIIGTAALGMLLIGYQAGGVAAALLSIFVLSSAVVGLFVAIMFPFPISFACARALARGDAAYRRPWWRR